VIHEVTIVHDEVPPYYHSHMVENPVVDEIGAIDETANTRRI
jgi:hypothetical protein